MEIQGDIFCGKHTDQRLTNRLKGNVGHCARCGLFVRALGAPEIVLDRPPAEAKPKRKRAVKTPAKKTRQRKASATAKV